MGPEEKLLAILKKENKALTTDRIQAISFILKEEYCIDSIVPALNNLLKKGLVTRTLSNLPNGKKGYVWSLKREDKKGKNEDKK